MELSENYKSFLGNFLRYFLVFSKIMFVNIKKSALKHAHSSRKRLPNNNGLQTSD